jgi:hypothetical protein
MNINQISLEESATFLLILILLNRTIPLAAPLVCALALRSIGERKTQSLALLEMVTVICGTISKSREDSWKNRLEEALGNCPETPCKK